MSLLALTPKETQARLVELGAKPFHAKILRTAVFEKGCRDYSELTSLPAGLRSQLASELPLFTGHEAARSVASDDTTKLLIEYPGRDGEPPVTIETVWIPSRRAGRGATLCVSTQVGCPVACPFCASGRLGLERNLTRAEILEEFLRGASLGPLARVVVMGIGEPLLNQAELLPALDVVHDELGIGARKITVSTVGFPERLHKLARSREGGPRFQLAISLHSPIDEQRQELVPAMAKVPIEDVLDAGDDWFRQTGREITYEYVLLGGVNDTEQHALELARRLRGRRATVNLIPYNPVEGDRYQRPEKMHVNAFADDLKDHGVVATVRWSRGLEADAACGQLRLAGGSRA